MIATRLLFAAALASASLALPAAAAAPDSAKDPVWAAETAFAKSMADRDVQAFSGYVSDEAVFFGGPQPLRGKANVVAQWTAFFNDKDAPFSWVPDQVKVLDSGTLALSTGIVRDRSGKPVARFNSIWRLEAPNQWRVVFDKGSPLEAASK